MTTLIETRGLEAGYGDLSVLRAVNIEVSAGEVVALLGPNGAGKTTTLLTLAGAIPRLAGDILFLGAPTTAPLHRRARQGLGFITEERSVFMGMSTADNLRVAGVEQDEALALFPELKARLHIKAGLLSGGEQQMLTLARALARKPKLLLADELSLGLAPLVVQRLLEAVRSAADVGLGVLLVEQHVREVMKFADRVYVMRRGQIVLGGAADEVRDRLDEIEQSYMSAERPSAH